MFLLHVLEVDVDYIKSRMYNFDIIPKSLSFWGLCHFVLDMSCFLVESVHRTFPRVIIKLAIFTESDISSSAESDKQEIVNPAGIVILRLLYPWQRRFAEIIIDLHFVCKRSVLKYRLALNKLYGFLIDVFGSAVLLCQNQGVSIFS